MRVAVAQLVPPVPADDAVLADPAVRPQPVVAVLVQVDGLEYVLLKRDLLCKLTLIVRRVEAHLELRCILRVRRDVVHQSEVVRGELEP